MTARPRLLALATLVVLTATGCKFSGLTSVNLPGGAAQGSPTYRVVAVFDNVQDLVPQSAVRVNDVAVGSVSDVTLTKDYKARVTMKVKKSVQLPANTVATLQQTTLLGEKFIGLAPPDGVQPTGRLGDGAVIPEDRTLAYPDVEEVFGALSLVLNGGSIERLQTIDIELTKALQGREGTVKDVLRQLNTFVGALAAQKAQIVRALDQLDRLSATLAQQKQTVATALEQLPPGIKVLAQNRQALVDLLQGFRRLADVGTHVIEASRADTVQSLANLKPVLTKLAAAQQNLPKALELLPDYPFPRDATSAVPGDYTGLRVTAAPDTLFQLLAPPSSGEVPLPSGGAPAKSGPTTPTPSLPDLGGLLGSVLPTPGPSASSSRGGGLLGLLGGALR